MSSNKKKTSKHYKKFVDAMRAHGGVKFMDLGGSPSLTPTTHVSPISNTGLSLQPGITINPTANIDQAFGIPNISNNLVSNLASGLTVENTANAALAPTTNLNYNPAINAGLTGTEGNLANEQALQQQLAQQAVGQGPNPAQAALNQSTGANVANQAALAASQRGASSNVGLLERQAAQQGAQTQQQAVGQSATLQAQQQLAAQQGELALQGNVGQQAGQLYNSSIQGNTAQNANLVQNYGQAQQINAGIAGQNAAAGNATIGGIASGVGAAGTALAGNLSSTPATTGISSVPSASSYTMPAFGSYADGGEVSDVQPQPRPMAPTPALNTEGIGPISFAGKYLNAPAPTGQSAQSSTNNGITSNGNAPIINAGGAGGGSADSGLGATLTTMATIAALALNKGGDVKPVKGEVLAAKGKMVPGKAKVKGDSLKNDHVPAMLSPGEIVIPRSIAQGPNAATNAARFVQQVLAKSKARGR
jgi:hypothetical protein